MIRLTTKGYGKMEEENRKENRRINFKQKNFKKVDKDYLFEKKDVQKSNKAFRHKKQEIEQEEIWQQWEDEVY